MPTVLGKGNRRAKVPLSPATLQALHDYLDDRTGRAALDGWLGMGGPLLATTTGGMMRPSQLWELRAPTRRYDHSRDSLDRSAVYAVAAYLARLMIDRFPATR